ncbi:MAG: tripartite tricarboxylate transporter substrate binding protein [Desulfopila sp.]
MVTKKIAYAWDDFSFLGLLEISPFILTVNADSPYQTFAELKQAIIDKKELSYSSAGIGNLQHLGIVLLLDELGVSQDSLRHIPFKGGGNAAAAAVGGHVTIFFQNSSGVINHIESGKLRALAVTTAERAPYLPDVPTFRELGYADMETILGWTGLWGPPGLDSKKMAVWADGLEKLSHDSGWIKATEELGSTPRILSPEETKSFVEKQYASFNNLVEKLGLVIQ